MGLLGFAVGSLRGGVFGLFLGFTLEVFCLLGSEKVLNRGLCSAEKKYNGFYRSIELALKDVGLGNPQFLIYQAPEPQILMARSFLGRGTVWLSQGLLVLLTEPELQSLLRFCARKIGGKGIILRSLGATLGALVMSLSPRGWLYLVEGKKLPQGSQPCFYTPGSAFSFLSVFTLGFTFCRLGKISFRTETSWMQDESVYFVLQKMDQASLLWGTSPVQSSLAGFAFDYHQKHFLEHSRSL